MQIGVCITLLNLFNPFNDGGSLMKSPKTMRKALAITILLSLAMQPAIAMQGGEAIRNAARTATFANRAKSSLSNVWNKATHYGYRGLEKAQQYGKTVADYATKAGHSLKNTWNNNSNGRVKIVGTIGGILLFGLGVKKITKRTREGQEQVPAEQTAPANNKEKEQVPAEQTALRQASASAKATEDKQDETKQAKQSAPADNKEQEQVPTEQAKNQENNDENTVDENRTNILRTIYNNKGKILGLATALGATATCAVYSKEAISVLTTIGNAISAYWGKLFGPLHETAKTVKTYEVIRGLFGGSSAKDDLEEEKHEETQQVSNQQTPVEKNVEKTTEEQAAPVEEEQHEEVKQVADKEVTDEQTAPAKKEEQAPVEKTSQVEATVQKKEEKASEQTVVPAKKEQTAKQTAPVEKHQETQQVSDKQTVKRASRKKAPRRTQSKRGRNNRGRKNRR